MNLIGQKIVVVGGSSGMWLATRGYPETSTRKMTDNNIDELVSIIKRRIRK